MDSQKEKSRTTQAPHGAHKQDGKHDKPKATAKSKVPGSIENPEVTPPASAAPRKRTRSAKAQSPARKFDLAAIQALSMHAEAMQRKQRELLLKPLEVKDPPVFTGKQLADLCGIDARQVPYLAKRDDMPPGAPGEKVGQRRTFTLAETRQWVQQYADIPKRPEGVDGAVIAVVNFKGGSTKTTTAFNLAQGLTLRGRNVLLIDIDPQGSATTLTGRHPTVEVRDEQTISSIIYAANVHDGLEIDEKKQEVHDQQEQDRLYMDNLSLSLPQPTYWDGMDVIPSTSSVFTAEMYFSQLANSTAGFQWWNVLSNALKPLRQVYDVIIFDTAPALSFLTVNAALASDGLVMPVPPEHLDYSSSIAFWSLLHEVLEPLQTKRGYHKEFDFLDILVSKVDSSNMANGITKNWISMTYGDYVVPFEIPKSVASSSAANSYATIHDASLAASQSQKRLRTAYDQFSAYVDGQICRNVWEIS